jgi:hypothetical protein
MKIIYTVFLFLIVCSAYAQDSIALTPGGIKLQEFYLRMDVEHHWIAGHHINWETGEPDMPQADQGIKTHCSAFVASACEQVSVYILRPPQHGQVLLANAQYDWLMSNKGESEGWHRLMTDDNYRQAQQLANQGKMVVAVYRNSNRKKPGHIALVMPVLRTAGQIQEEGPELIMAGTNNYNYISLKKGFKSHISTWPETEILFYVQDKILF